MYNARDKSLKGKKSLYSIRVGERREIEERWQKGNNLRAKFVDEF